MYAKFAALAALVASATAQQVCTTTAERHPPLSWQRCSAGGSCTTVSGSVVLDSNWRWTHRTSDTTNCYSGNVWDSTICTTGADCASKCCVEGADYASTYGVTTSGNSLNLKFVTKHQHGTNVGSRTYLMESDTKYQMFNLLGNEFTFDVDVSNLGCGLNGALYFVTMDADGGMSKYSSNKAGAKYGTGYCDSQCPRDIKWINGEANVVGWSGSTNDPNAGFGSYGACCDEMDVWEANNMATAFTPHPCTTLGQTRCEGDGCGGTYSEDRYGGICDPDGCDFNSYRQGNKTFYGKGMTVDTTKKLTVVTQFIKNAAGELSEIKRFYAQNGVVIPNSESTIAGVPGNSITTAYCDAQKAAFGDEIDFQRKGGLVQMGKALEKGMVLVMSIWDDHAANMLWLDSTYPVDAAGRPGAERGACPTTSGVPAEVEAQVPNSNVVFSNIKFGPIGSTVAGLPDNGGGPSSSSTIRTSTTSTRTSTSTSIRTTSTSTRTTSSQGGQATATAKRWQQCGGIGWTGPTICESPYSCTKLNDWFYQCL
ncbi:carbohydrate-binding module family 1 protein [Parathielavia appendiculata]|uniref:Glucanase n=1 Tax=Parathielavia appendiculata TaxID=2587402 RepID=A0AAN6TVU2_9PEZI|nr:carbohydrate-binding module family 1 protein [Parathielavia appendiculata]